MPFRGRCRRALLAVPLAALLVSWGAPAGAQSDPASPPTTNALEGLVNGLLGGGTTVPPSPPAPTPAEAGVVVQDPGALPPAAGEGAPAPDGPRVVPPEAQAAIDALHRTPGRTTDQLMAALHQLIDVGLGPEEAAVIGMGQFPVGGQANYASDFLFPRFNPDFHPHMGNDIFAAEGTPVRAPEDGTVRFTEGGISGKAVYVTAGDGTYYFGCHLVAFADIPSGSSVTQGQIVGFVGSTGDAAGGSPHLHFEIHPGGGGAVDPKATLDRWLDEALANLPNIVATYRQVGMPRSISYAGQLRRFDEPLAGGRGISALLTDSSSNAGIQRLTELRAARSLTSDSAAADAAMDEAWKTADRTSRSLLAPLTPGPLQLVLVRESG